MTPGYIIIEANEDLEMLLVALQLVSSCQNHPNKALHCRFRQAKTSQHLVEDCYFMAASQILPISLLDPVDAFVTAVPVVCTIFPEKRPC